MALLQINYQSQALRRMVTLQAIIPADKADFQGAYFQRDKPFKTLYLLHGMLGNHTDWVSGTRIQAWAQEKNLAVIMPSGENSFYFDHEGTDEKYGEYIGKELVQFTRKLFPLSHEREDTYIAGLSMGGYGAVRNGLLYADTFGCLAGLSSALDVKGLTGIKCIQSALGDPEKLPGSDKDVKALVKRRKESGKPMPAIYLACGDDDFLKGQNDDFDAFLTENQVAHLYETGPGNHEWYFWDTYIRRVLDWLPLEEPEESLSSGNISSKK